MKGLFTYFLFLMLPLTSCFCAENIPTINVSEGDNIIKIDLSNNLLFDMENINLKVNCVLPEWLKISNSSGNISVPKGEKLKGGITINFSLDNPPDNFEQTIPFIAEDNNGNSWKVTIQLRPAKSTPVENSLIGNFPNPFNPTTTIKFSVKDNYHTKLIIYNMIGQKVRTLVDSHQSAGLHEVYWDGRDENGFMVSSGTYFYKLSVGNFTKTNKMMLLE